MVCKCWLQTAHDVVERTRGRGTTESSTVQLQLRLSPGFAFCSWVSGLVCRAGVFSGPEEVQRARGCHLVMDRE